VKPAAGVLVDLEAWALLDATHGLHRREHCAATAPRCACAAARGALLPLVPSIGSAGPTARWRGVSAARKLLAVDGAAYLHGAAIDVTARHEAAALQRRLEAESARRAEIEASRARIVEAADAARRRLERDLHDGAQQQQVVASLTLNRAAARAR
jgi:signal transduction histidine kinase